MLTAVPMPRTVHPELAEEWEGVQVRPSIAAVSLVVPAERRALAQYEGEYSLPVCLLVRKPVTAPAPFVGPTDLLGFYAWPVWTDGRLWVAGEAELHWMPAPPS